MVGCELLNGVCSSDGFGGGFAHSNSLSDFSLTKYNFITPGNDELLIVSCTCCLFIVTSPIYPVINNFVNVAILHHIASCSRFSENVHYLPRFPDDCYIAIFRLFRCHTNVLDIFVVVDRR